MVSRLCAPLVLILLAACAASTGPAPADGDPGVVRTLDAGERAWSDLLTERPTTLVVFATVWCEPCKREWSAVAAWAKAAPDRRVLYVISGTAPDRVADFAKARGLAQPGVTVLVDDDGAIARAYEVSATPTLVLHRADGARGSPVHSIEAL